MAETYAKTARLEPRVHGGLVALIRRAAEIEGLSKTGFITSALQKEATQKMQRVLLECDHRETEPDSERVVHLLKT